MREITYAQTFASLEIWKDISHFKVSFCLPMYWEDYISVFYCQKIIPPKIAKIVRLHMVTALFTSMKDFYSTSWSEYDLPFVFLIFQSAGWVYKHRFSHTVAVSPMRQPTSCSNLLTQLLGFLVTEGVEHKKQEQVDVFLIKRSMVCSYFNNCQRFQK